MFALYISYLLSEDTLGVLGVPILSIVGIECICVGIVLKEFSSMLDRTPQIY